MSHMALNVLSLLYLMVLADSHTISKSINNDEKIDDKFESINDVDRPIIPKTRKDRQHKYKVYYRKDDDALQHIKETKPYLGVEKATDKITVKPTSKATTENAKRHKSPKRRVGFWKKLRGKDKKKEKETEKHDSKDRRRRIYNHKKDSHKIAYLTTKPGPGLAKKKHRKKMFLRQVEHQVSKRDASGLFSTRPYSNTPQSYKLQMGIAPQVDNMLKSKKYKIKYVHPHTEAVATAGTWKRTENLQAQLGGLNSDLSELKERYGLMRSTVRSTPDASSQHTTTEIEYQGTAQIDHMVRAMKAKAINMMSFQTSSVTELSNSSANKATIDSNQPALVSSFCALVSSNEIAKAEKRTVAKTGTHALNPNASKIYTNTESHYIAARSIKKDAMTIAMNVEDLLQKELKNIYNKVKHKVSNECRKETQTLKSTLKEGLKKLTSKLCGKTCKMASKRPSSTTNPPTHRKCSCKPKPLMMKGKLAPVLDTKPAPVIDPKSAPVPGPKPTPVLDPKPACRTRTATSTINTTAPRVRKKDEKEEDRVVDGSTPEAYGEQTYDDYVMLTLYEQMLAKSEDNARKLLSTPEYPIYAKKKREARRLSKRNPETLTDVKLTEVVRNIYDDGGNMPDYEYIDPAVNLSSAGRTTGGSNNYNDGDYILEDEQVLEDFNSQGSEPFEKKPKLKGTSPGPKKGCIAADAYNSARDSGDSVTVAYITSPNIPASESNFQGLSNKICYNKFVDGYKHYLKFQKELKNQNFSNLVKYQAHKHHSVDDIGKYILNKIPPLPSRKRKRNQRFSDDSDNNMDYQEITTKSDDSWFRKHFYLFIDNGPPKKYHTSETVEVKPGSVIVYMTDTTTPTISQEGISIRIDSDNIHRKAKNTEEISLDDLSKILDSIKNKGTNNPLTKATPQTQKKNSGINMGTYNATGEATMQGRSFIGKFLGVKRSHASNKIAVTPADNQQVRFKRSNTKESFENTLIADCMNNHITEVKAATTGTKDVFADAAQTSNKKTNKYGFVDIDLVPRQTAIVKLRDNTKKSRIRNFFKKFHFKKDKTKKPKPKRSANYNYYLYSPNPRRGRFSPLKELKNLFRCKEEGKHTHVALPPRSTEVYDTDNLHLDYESKFDTLSVADMQKQIPNISDFEAPANERTTKEKAATDYKLDQKDRELLFNYHSSTAKPLFTSLPKGAKHIIITTPVTIPKATHLPIEIGSMSPSTIITSLELPRVPPWNVMTVNLKTMRPSTSLIITEKQDYKKNIVPYPLQVLPEELSIRSKLTRVLKFPLGQRRYKLRRADDFEPDEIEKNYLGFDGPSVSQDIHDLGSRNAVHSGKRKAAYKPYKKQKSVYPDYFNDLLMWHNDILNLDSVHNSSLNNILETFDKDTASSYTTPDTKNLMTELNEMSQFLVNNLNNSAVTVATGSAKFKTKDRVGIRALGNQLDHVEEGVIRSVAMNDNTIVTCKDVFIKGEAKYFQYNKPKSPHALASSHFVRKLDPLNKIDDVQIDEMVKIRRKEPRTESPTPADIPAVAPIIVDTTLMAYDDDVDSINKELEVKKSKARISKSGKTPPPKVKTEHTSVLKTHKAPVQYYTTPLPMKAQDFQRFLKDHQMSVDYVTAPIKLKLPTLKDTSTTKKKHNKGSKHKGETRASTAGLAKFVNNLNSEPRTTTPKTIELTTAGSKSSQSSVNMTALQLKLENITKAMGKLSMPTTELQKKNRKVVKNSKLSQKLVNSSKNSYWSEDFDRYKRSNVLKLPRSATLAKNNKATHEAKYYNIFKKKTKEKVMEKKVTDLFVTDRLLTEPVTLDPHNKDVEITIINFDDLEKMSTPQSLETSALLKKNEMFPDFSEMATTDTAFRPKMKITTQKEDMHNELLYKDVFNERPPSTAPTKEYSNADLTKRTEFDPLIIRDGKTNMNKLRYPFEKGPISPNIFNKMPHAKNANLPKRVHITSHHYKYDIYYDDVKKMLKDHGREGCGYSFKNCFSCRINEGSFVANGVNGEKLPETFYKLQLRLRQVTASAMNLSRKRAPSEEGWNIADFKRQIMGRTRRSRPRRRVRGPEKPQKKRKHFIFRGCKLKPTGRLTQSKGYFEKHILITSPGNSADDSTPKLEKHFTNSMENTGRMSCARNVGPVTEIEDLVTMLDKEDLGVTKPDIDAAVTLAAVRTEFLTSSFRDGARTTSKKAKNNTVTTETPVTKETSVTTTTPATTAATNITTTGSTKVLGSPVPSSLIYALKHPKKTTPSNKSSEDKEPPQKDRHMRLSKFYVLQSHLKNFMKYWTRTTKRANVTSTKQANTSSTSKGKKKRTCFTTTTTERVLTLEPSDDISPADEGISITYHSEIYDESLMNTPPTTIPPCEDKTSSSHVVYKREVEPNTFTAKDVAALEVIVDLLKNTLNYEETLASAYHDNMFQPITTTPINSNFSTNTIQVHIAIPYDYQVGKKRSPPLFPGPVRVRKVFSARMSSPVDLEYQVHSIEGTIAPTSTDPAKTSIITHFADSLTPGMYLLIDNPKSGFGLKPLLGQVRWSDLKQRQLISSTTARMTEPKPTESRGETTSLKSLARVTLSKEFVAAIHQQLLELYENRSRVYKDLDGKETRKARSVWRSWKLKGNEKRRKKGAEKYIIKRRINWDAVKKYFGHDRVCDCKCKVNTPMCSACAASDAVIDELIFEFDNIGRYMTDHCTEIQTFFWMNPVGGQKLRDSVSKIDRSLTDYCKRVKGKCQGRLCKTFSTYIDKRNFIKTAKMKKVENISCLINDLATLAHDLNMTVALDVCYNAKLKENGEKFINLMNNCINYKSLSKRSNPTRIPKRMVKQVYSLDNINVNIICNPESPATAYEQMMSATIPPHANSEQIIEFTNDQALDFEPKKPKGFRGHLFPSKNKKSKLFSYFDFNKKHYKRQVNNQASMPLISDGGGAFWYDYLKAGTNEPRLARGSIKDTPTITVDVVQRAVTAGKVLKGTATAANNDVGKDTIYMTVRTRPERNPRDAETTTDSLSWNINQMLQLFGSLQDVESMNNNANSNSTTNLPIDASIHRKVSQDTLKNYSLVDEVEQNVNQALAKNRTTVTTTINTKKMTQKIPTALEKEMDETSTLEHIIETVPRQAATMKAMLDGASDNVAFISSIMESKVSANTLTTNNSSTMVSLAAESTASINTATSRLVTIKGVAPKGDKKSKSSPIFKKTTKFGFKNMIKAATKIFGKELTQTPKKTTKTSTTAKLETELTTIQTDFVDVVSSSPANDYVADENTEYTNVTPTILIINDYNSKIGAGSMSDVMKENYKNLLLSIIQFETNNLNEEWNRIFYGGVPRRDHRGETDIKRASRTPVETKAFILLTTKSTPAAAFSEEDTYLEPASDNTSKAESLLNKIASKMGLKGAKQKMGLPLLFPIAGKMDESSRKEADRPAFLDREKHVVNQPRVRESRKDSKKLNFIRNRKLRINKHKKDPSELLLNQEACYTRRTTQPTQLCDVQATFKHIQTLQTSVPKKTFENLMKNVSCYKYRNADASFIIPYKKRGKTWDWIRNKRSLKHFHNKIKDTHDFDDETYVVDFEDDPSDIFERFVKGDNGVYEIVKRKKRKVNLEVLERGLRNIPTLMPTEDDLYVMVGDSVTLDCGVKTPVRTSDGKFHWETDRKRMLEQDNVEMDGLTVAIHKVEPKNSGTYTCIRGHTIRKNVMLNVMDVPYFDVVFLPLYETKDNCSYDDLIAIQYLGNLMDNGTRCGKACSVRIDEPVCQRDRSNNNTMVRATAVISITPNSVNCSMQCRRDIQTSLVMLCVTNAAVLPTIPVEIVEEGESETLTPCKDCVRPVVTHKLRKKDSNGHKEYRQLSSLLSPGKVDVVILCPAGYYLLSKYKLCSCCPPNTSSKAGENTCRTCPRGTRAEPGAATCRAVKVRHHRRYDWWWYPPCGYVVAFCGVLFGCTACVLLSVIVHVVSRDADLPEHDGDDEEQTIPKPMMNVASAHFPGARPLSPSRVILPRFFRPSLTSSRATDSQETKFELWKERNMPPPLPPIDFDP